MRPDTVLDTLQAAGFEAWYAGGCVRDTLLGRPVHDWDVTTSALPEQVIALFPKTVPTGLKHGTVTVLAQNQSVEVTTYRADGSYHDGRHPDGVRFVRSLREDTARRDFTVNAMVMAQDGRIVDYHGGRADLAAKVLRCVGEPEQRFREDVLRMLRACRFAAQLGFSIEPETWAALLRCAPLCDRLSRERITAEVTRTLLSPRPQWVSAMIETGLLRSCGLSGRYDLTWLSGLPATESARWAGLGILLPALDYHAFRLPANLVKLCQSARERWSPGRGRLAWKRLIAAEGTELAALLASMEQTGAVSEILTSGECVSLKALAVSGRDFPELRGAAVGQMLHALLEHVLASPQDNRREALLALAKTLEVSRLSKNEEMQFRDRAAGKD